MTKLSISAPTWNAAQLSLLIIGVVLWAQPSQAQGKARKQLQISASAATKCDHAVAEGMMLFYHANTSFLARKGTTKPITDAEKELLQRREDVGRRIDETCFLHSFFANGDPIHQLMAESHWQLAQERYALQIEFLMQATALDITQDMLANAKSCN